MWMQIVGKIRLTLSPWVNHGWHCTLYVTSRGLTTSPIPHGSRTFQIDFDFYLPSTGDFVERRLYRRLSLEPQSGQHRLYTRLTAELDRLDLHVDIHRKPNEVADPIRFDQDEFTVLRQRIRQPLLAHLLSRRTGSSKSSAHRFTGKCSPVHFFWGAPDLAVTRILRPARPGASRRRPEPAGQGHPGGVLARGNTAAGSGLEGARSPMLVLFLRLSGAGRLRGCCHSAARSVLQRRPARIHFALRCRTIIRQPEDTLLEFLETTYSAAADLGKWDRAALERLNRGPERKRSSVLPQFDCFRLPCDRCVRYRFRWVAARCEAPEREPVRRAAPTLEQVRKTAERGLAFWRRTRRSGGRSAVRHVPPAGR